MQIEVERRILSAQSEEPRLDVAHQLHRGSRGEGKGLRQGRAVCCRGVALLGQPTMQLVRSPTPSRAVEAAPSAAGTRDPAVRGKGLWTRPSGADEVRP